MTTVRAVTLDAAGTLFAPAEPVSVVYARVAALHGVVVSVGDVARRFRHAMATAPPLAFPGAGPAALHRHERAWWAAVVASSLGRAARGGALGAIVDDLLAHYAAPAAWRVYDDVPPALAGLRAAGLRLAVVSNFDGRLPALLAGLGLASRFDAVVWSSRVGAAKPDPRIFAAALEVVGVAPGDAVHVGDGLAADVGGAHAAGMRAVLVDRDGEAPAGASVPTLRTLTPLRDMLES